MKIGIIGAGSIGLLLASYLSNAFTVTLFTRTEEQAKKISNDGISLWKDQSQKHITINAVPFHAWNGNEDLTIIAVKQYQLETVIEKINQTKNKEKNLLFLQNGMGHVKLFSKILATNLFVGTVEHGALKENNCVVRHNGEGVVNVAVFSGESHKLAQFVELSPTQFPVVLKEDYYEMLVNKLVANAVINPLTAILQVRNGELVSNPFLFESLKNLFAEITDILNLKNPSIYFEKIIEICQNTATNRSSMLKDIEAGRQTEVDAILGYLLGEAERKGIKAPLISSYYNLVKGKEISREESR